MFSLQVAMCNFPTIKDTANVAIAAMLSGIQWIVFLVGVKSGAGEFVIQSG
ncbi:putative D-lactate dehydrogenase (cytochrome) [Helianthus annuus]|nr:putative D-lactate dehydrogenase (cytochrome) [Helianthus annuus]KAJ0782601.1 putative D-lactate dehydrogenase (cytochrome) [Helianthus annuus]KAJ0947224.1 putative D-lactate dehydrogenase (cytochrome) [Helianthus annuus]KAJ0956220.1 putative D-lactate dehydrogenase (cytochrome) [Helianthus annuus]